MFRVKINYKDKDGGRGRLGLYQGFHGQEVLSTRGEPLGMNCSAGTTGRRHRLRIDGFHLLGNIGAQRSISVSTKCLVWEDQAVLSTQICGNRILKRPVYGFQTNYLNKLAEKQYTSNLYVTVTKLRILHPK